MMNPFFFFYLCENIQAYLLLPRYLHYPLGIITSLTAKTQALYLAHNEDI